MVTLTSGGGFDFDPKSVILVTTSAAQSLTANEYGLFYPLANTSAVINGVAFNTSTLSAAIGVNVLVIGTSNESTSRYSVPANNCIEFDWHSTNITGPTPTVGISTASIRMNTTNALLPTVNELNNSTAASFYWHLDRRHLATNYIGVKQPIAAQSRISGVLRPEGERSEVSGWVPLAASASITGNNYILVKYDKA